ncbi:hypothetical protein DOY81_010673, partial [Sarcophaga bullata]
EVDLNDSDELAPIPEVDDILEKTSQASEIFAMPNAKQCNSIIRYTPEPTTLPTIPNWLQLVLRSKCNCAANVIMLMVQHRMLLLHQQV